MANLENVPPSNLLEPSPQPVKKRIKNIKQNHRFRVLESHGSTLRILDESTWQEKRLVLSTDLDIAPMTEIHLFHDQLEEDDIQMDENTLLVVDPDTLVPATTLSNSFDCLRKSVLSIRIRTLDKQTPPLVYGNLLHKLFQLCLQKRDLSSQWISTSLKEIIENHILDVYSIGKTEEQVYEDLRTEIPKIQNWFQLHMNPNASLYIEETIDIEERAYSPKYGLKGNLDATVRIRDKLGQHVVPFELKTGKKTHVAYATQVMLYVLMLQEKYGSCSSGILAHLHSGETTLVKTKEHEIQSILDTRNRLATYLRRTDLPPMIKNKHTCSRCYVKTDCMIMHAALENGDAYSSGVPELFEKVILNPQDKAFIERWTRVIDVEESINKGSTGFWSQSVSKRINQGTCITDLVVLNRKLVDQTSKQSKLEFLMVQKTKGKSFLDYDFAEHDNITVTIGHQVSPVAKGYVSEIAVDKITIIVDRDILLHQAEFYSIDKESFSSGQGLARNNLLDLFRTQNRLRERIVDLATPVFEEETRIMDSRLNVCQQECLNKILSAKDYCLVLGMPGTGKSTTLAVAIETLAAMGKSVLVTSYTNSAVDNVLLKLRNVNYVRIGSFAKMHPDVKARMQQERDKLKTADDLGAYYDRRLVIGTTALGINHPLFTKRSFDYCFVDESSQMALPICLGPIRLAKTFVLVGDHYQLPPLYGVIGLKEPDPSLFKILTEAHPHSVSFLVEQYRMNRDVMRLSNHLVYDYRLKCGTPELANKKLDLNPKWFQGHASCPCWLPSVLDPSKSVLFVNTDLVPALEVRKGPFIENPVESELIAMTLKALFEAGLKESDVGIMSPYKNQLRLLQRALSQYPNIEILTVDKYQGRDKAVVLMSMTRSNDVRNAGDLVKDWRRLNVAMTRAKVKMLIFGSKSTLSASPFFKQLIDFVSVQGWTFDLPFQAHKIHK